VAGEFALNIALRWTPRRRPSANDAPLSYDLLGDDMALDLRCFTHKQFVAVHGSLKLTAKM